MGGMISIYPLATAHQRPSHSWPMLSPIERSRRGGQPGVSGVLNLIKLRSPNADFAIGASHSFISESGAAKMAEGLSLSQIKSEHIGGVLGVPREFRTLRTSRCNDCV